MHNLIEWMLEDFMFDLNNQITRDKAKAETIIILEGIGLDWFNVICDESNNTPAVIMNNELIVSIDVRRKAGEQIKSFNARVGKPYED